MRETTPRAWAVSSTNGIVNVLNVMPLNIDSSECPSVSAVTPVRSETKQTVRVGAVTPRASRPLLSGQHEPRVEHGVRIQGQAVDALLHEPAREIRVIRRPLAADADVLAVLAAGLDCERQQRLDGLV